MSTIAGILQGSVATTDIVARTGGDEFAVLVLGGGEEKILKTIGTIQQTIDKYNQHSNIEISLSIGYWERWPGCKSGDDDQKSRRKHVSPKTASPAQREKCDCQNTPKDIVGKG